MSLAGKRVTVYLRTLIVVLVVGAIGLVLFKNRSHTAKFWFFGLTHEDTPTNIVWLMLWTSGGAIVTWRIFSFGRGLWRDLSEVAQLKASEEKDKQLKRRSAELDERVRRMEEQTKRTAVSGGESGIKKE